MVQNPVLDTFWFTFLGLGSESPRAHLSPCVLSCYNTITMSMLNIVVWGDSVPIPISLNFKFTSNITNVTLGKYWSVHQCCMNLEPCTVTHRGRYTGWGKGRRTKQLLVSPTLTKHDLDNTITIYVRVISVQYR